MKKTGDLKLNGETIATKDTYTYLGLVIDRSLTWNAHINYLRAECRRRMNLLKHLTIATYILSRDFVSAPQSK